MIFNAIIFHEETRVKSMSKRITSASDSKASEKSEGKSRVSDNAPLVRREIFNMETLNILLSAIILVVLLFVVGGSLGEKSSVQVPAAKFASDENSCRIFCENNPQYGEAKFGGVSENGHCLCEIKIESMPNYVKNKTLSVNLLIDQGIIIRQATLKDGVASQALPSIETLQ